MFDIGWSELVIAAVVALIVIGPKELPGVLRAIGHWMGKIRRMASEFQGQFQEAMREAEMADLSKQVDDLGAAANDLTNFNPIESAQKEIDQAFESSPASIGDAATETATAADTRSEVVADVATDGPTAPAEPPPVASGDVTPSPDPVARKQAGGGA
jgi:sec-independent protein translocase protein TatB